MNAPRLEVTDDGGDIIHIAFEDGAETRLYLIEDAMEVYEVSGIVNANSDKGIYSVFVLWCDMLVPHDGLRCRPDPWLAALLALGGKQALRF